MQSTNHPLNNFIPTCLPTSPSTATRAPHFDDISSQTFLSVSYLMTQDQYGGYQQGYDSSIPQPDQNYTSIQDIPLFQTPKRALLHQRYITGIILGSVVGWLINWGIGLLSTSGKPYVFLWSWLKPWTEGTNEINPYGTPIWFDLILTITLSIFLGSPITYLFIKTDVAKGKAIPIQPHDLLKYRFLGVTTRSLFARMFIFTFIGTAIVLPSFVLITSAACSGNGMKRKPIPDDFSAPGECYMERGTYSALKGVAAVIAALVVSPLVELASLNKENLPEETFQAYTKIVDDKNQQNQQAALLAGESNAYSNTA